MTGVRRSAAGRSILTDVAGPPDGAFRLDVAMDADQKPQSLPVRAPRCCGCGRPVWPVAGEQHAPTPALCDYCAVVAPLS
jgi:hypothetical protein